MGAVRERIALTSYVQLYLREEIQAEAATRNLAGFARFLPIAGLFHGQILNVSSLARDAGVARTTVQGYLQILDDTLFTFQVPAFEGRLRVREKRHPKLSWVDPGLVRAVTRTLAAPTPETTGALFEGDRAVPASVQRLQRSLRRDRLLGAGRRATNRGRLSPATGAQVCCDRGRGGTPLATRDGQGIACDRRARRCRATDRGLSRGADTSTRAGYRGPAGCGVRRSTPDRIVSAAGCTQRKALGFSHRRSWNVWNSSESARPRLLIERGADGGAPSTVDG